MKGQMESMKAARFELEAALSMPHAHTHMLGSIEETHKGEHALQSARLALDLLAALHCDATQLCEMLQTHQPVERQLGTARQRQIAQIGQLHQEPQAKRNKKGKKKQKNNQ